MVRHGAIMPVRGSGCVVFRRTGDRRLPLIAGRPRNLVGHHRSIVRPPACRPRTDSGVSGRSVAGGEQRLEDVLHLVEAVLLTVEACHVVASCLVVEGQGPGERRDGVTFP